MLKITEPTTQQINTALNSLKIEIDNEVKKAIKNIEPKKVETAVEHQKELKFEEPLIEKNGNVSLDTRGKWEGTANSAINANIKKTTDTINGDKIQIGSGIPVNITNAVHAVNADNAASVNKVKNALTVNGKTYDGSSAVNAGVQTVANGGTGQTTANDAANSFINSLTTGDSVPVDNDYYISQYVNGGTNTNTYHRRPVSKLWEYIKDKISSVLGLTATNYGGKASTATTATNADITKTTDTTNGDKIQIGSGAAVNITNAEHAVNADNAISANKVKNALTVNGKTYDGSSAVNAGVQTVANGGTGQTTANAAANSFINSLTTGGDVPVDNDYYISQYVNGGTNTNTYHRRPVSKLWEYIKDKISSVLGLTATNYGGKASTAGTADNAKNMYFRTLDLSSLDETKFYPVVCISYNNFAEVAIHSPPLAGNEKYNQNRIHFDISTYGWNDLPYTLNIREYACYDNNEITIGCIGRGLKQGGWAIWLRGGRTYNCWTRDCTLTLKTTDYTYYDEKYTVGTNYYGGGNTDVSIIFTPQSTIKSGAYSIRNVAAPNFIGNLTGNVTGNVSGSSGSCTGNSATATSANITKTTDTTNGDKIQIGSGTAVNITNAVNATNADIKKTTDTINGDKIQIGSGTAVNITNAKHAVTAGSIDTSGKGNIIDLIYPVGSIYTSVSSTNPQTLFDRGTWVSIGSGRVLQGVGSGQTAGSTVEAGLPNIKGTIDTWNAVSGGELVTKSGVSKKSWTANAGASASVATFDARRANSIYGNSTTVQPPAFLVYFWKRTE